MKSHAVEGSAESYPAKISTEGYPEGTEFLHKFLWMVLVKDLRNAAKKH